MKNQSACTLCTSSAITAAAAPSADDGDADQRASAGAGRQVRPHRAGSTPFHANIEPADRIDALKLEVTAPMIAPRPSSATQRGRRGAGSSIGSASAGCALQLRQPGRPATRSANAATPSSSGGTVSAIVSRPGEDRVPLRLGRRLARQHALEVAVPRDAAEHQHQADVPPADDRRGAVQPGAAGRAAAAATRRDRAARRRRRPTRRRGRRPRASTTGSATARPSADQAELERVGVGDRPHAAEHRVGGDDDAPTRRIAVGERHAEHHAEGRADGDQQLGAPEHLAEQRRHRQHGRPPLAEARLERDRSAS